MIVLAPYRWEMDAALGQECWRGPGAGVDLRRRSEMTAKGVVTGYGIFEVADDAQVDGAEAFTGNGTRDRQMWRRLLGGNAAGSTPEELLFSQLTDEADDTGADGARPIRCINADDIELHFGGRKSRKLTAQQKVRQIQAIRRDLDKVFDDVESGKLPARTHRKMLAMEARKLGIRPRDLKSTDPRWRDEDAEEPQTLLYWGMYDMNRVNQVNGSWQVANNRVSAGTNAGNQYLTLGGTFSSDDHEVSFSNVDFITNGSFGLVWRMSTDPFGSEDCYLSLANGTPGVSSTLALYSIANGSPTLLVANNPNIYTSLPQRGKASSSTIQASHALSGAFLIAVTNTAHTVGKKAGAFRYSNTASPVHTATGLRGVDGGSLAPTVSSVSPSSGPTAGGTAIVIAGTNFDSDATSTTGGNANTSVQVYSDIEIRAVMPAGNAGAKDVAVTNVALGLTGTGAGAYTYVAPLGGPSVKRVGLGVGVGL